MLRDAVSQTANVGTVGKNGLRLPPNWAAIVPGEASLSDSHRKLFRSGFNRACISKYTKQIYWALGYCISSGNDVMCIE